MPEFKITETRTLTQERTALVSATNAEAIWLHEDFEVVADLSDWETVGSTLDVTDVDEA